MLVHYFCISSSFIINCKAAVLIDIDIQSWLNPKYLTHVLCPNKSKLGLFLRCCHCCMLDAWQAWDQIPRQVLTRVPQNQTQKNWDLRSRSWFEGSKPGQNHFILWNSCQLFCKIFSFCKMMRLIWLKHQKLHFPKIPLLVKLYFSKIIFFYPLIGE